MTAECTCPACEITSFADLGRGERVYVRGEDLDCPVHPRRPEPRKVYVGADGKHYPSRAEAGWNEP